LVRGRNAPDTLKLSPKNERELLRAVGTEDDDAFDVAGAAGAGDEGGEAGPYGTVALLDEFVASGEIGEQLVAAGEDDVILRQHAEGAAATVAGGEEDAAALRDEGVALGDAGVAGFIPLASVEERLAAVAEFVWVINLMPEPLQGVHDADSGLRADEGDEGDGRFWKVGGSLEMLFIHLGMSEMVKM
jgi:hypothetical protein